MTTFIKTIIIIICLISFLIWTTVKNENTLKNQLIIYKAIDLYEYDCYKYDVIPKVSKADVKHYLSAFFACDWGYKNLLPEKKYKLIRPYIRKAKEWERRRRDMYA